MRSSRIQAVEDVALEVAPGLSDEVRWFYGEVGGLTEVASNAPAEAVTCFKSAHINLFVAEVECPRIDPVAVRVTLSVTSLLDVAAKLADRGVAVTRESGLNYTDRRLIAQDPGGNRIAFKREWPDWPL